MTRSWTLSNNYIFDFEGWYYLPLDGGVFWNGSVHWTSLQRHPLLDFHSDSLYFNVDEEQLRRMPPMPPVPVGWFEKGRHSYFGESSGHLHYIHHIYKLESMISYLDVYEMEVDYSGWFLKFRVNLFNFSFPEFSILCVVRGGRELDEEEFYLVLKISDKVLRYNFKATTLKELPDVNSGRAWTVEPVPISPNMIYIPMFPKGLLDDDDDDDVHQYIESLSLV